MEKKDVGFSSLLWVSDSSLPNTASVLQMDAVDVSLLPIGDLDTSCPELGPKIIKPYSFLGQGI